MKKIIILIVALSMFVGSNTFAQKDEPSEWAIETVIELQSKEILRNESFSNYRENITRGDFIYLAVRLYEVIKGEEIVVDENINFTDTDDIYARKGATVKITSGVGNNLFGYNQLLTREQLATLMVNVMTLLEVEMNQAEIDLFADDDEISFWARDAIYRARANNIISGVGNNKVNPKGNASVQVALVITNNILNEYYTPKLTSQEDSIVALRKKDSDEDGLSDYHEIYKYFLNPNKADSDNDGIKDNDWNERKEAAYTIQAQMQVMKPFDVKDMNDDYQDIRVISETADTLVFDVVTYIHNTNNEAVKDIEGNPNWLTDYEGMDEVQPTLTANWNEDIRAQIIADLKADGIDFYSLKTDKELVEVVAPWIWKTSTFDNGGPSDFLVDFSSGVPTIDKQFIGKSIYSEYTSGNGTGNWSEQEIIDNLVMGDTMYQNKYHGSCSSSSTYQTTILRALGIPTRITFQVPLYNGEKNEQRALLDNINDSKVQNELKAMFKGIGDHFYNEVYIDGQWVRLNYGVLGANVYDEDNPMAILVNLEVANDFSEFEMNNTWASYIMYNREHKDQKEFLKLINITDE